MSMRGKVQIEKPLTRGEEREFKTALGEQGMKVLGGPYPNTVRRLMKSGKRKIGEALKVLIERGPHAAVIAQWEEFYLKFFGLTVDLSEVVIPKAPTDFNQLIIVAQGITLNAAMAACKKHFPTWQYSDDLDASVTKNDRTAEAGAYAVWFRNRVEADEETANQSADNLAKQGIKGITLLERILMELEYFGRTGQHLDIQNVTLCSGSRHSDGHVPHAHWHDGKIYVDWCNADRSYSHLRARVAVS